MMDCREAKQLLPLWIGQDLPDSSSAAEVASHLEHCSSCEQYRKGLQASLETLQCSTAVMFSGEHSRRSVWPNLVSRISEWERNHRRERFNGWIPASVMALAVALMVAVSIPSIHEEFFANGGELPNSFDLFGNGSEIHVDEMLPVTRDSGQNMLPGRAAFGTAVNFKKDQKVDRSPVQW